MLKLLQRSLTSTRFPLARRLTPFRSEPRGQDVLPAHELAINFSHILHEPADHPIVQAAVRTAGKPLRITTNPGVVLDSATNVPVDCWLAPSIGCPRRLPDLLDVNPEAIMLIDSGKKPVSNHQFFNAPAALTLPAAAMTVGIAAAVRRPGGRTLQFITRGPFNLPDETHQALGELEALIRAHADQWQPAACLWEEGFNP